MSLTDDLKARLSRLRGTKPVAHIARELNVPRSTVRGFFERMDRPAQPETPEPDTQGRRSSILRSEMAPLSIEVPKPVSIRDRLGFEPDTMKVLLYGDTHFPHHDPDALSIVMQVADLLQPDVLVHMGDLVDAYELARFDKNPDRKFHLQDEIDQARAHLGQMRLCCPDARFVLLEGNHEDRLRRTLWTMEGTAAVVRDLTKVKESLTWPALLGLDDLHIEFVPYGKHREFEFLPKFLLKHGDIVRQQSAYTARGELDKLNRSGASGHTHRLGVHHRRDFHGGHVWMETGCTCTLTPEYAPDPNWQQGCIVLTFDKETGAIGVEIIEIRNKLAVWRDYILRA